MAPLNVTFQTQRCSLDDARRAQMLEDLATLEKVVECFPVADLHVHINRHDRADDYHVKTALHLPRRTLFTGERNDDLHPAFERCVRKLLQKTKSYKEQMEGRPEFGKVAKGTQHPAIPDHEPDVHAIANALQERDYEAFRKAMRPYDQELHAAIGRRVQRYPEAQAELGQSLIITEIVEEVFLNAFESLPLDPRHLDRLGERLEDQIDASIEALLEDPAGEKKNLAYIFFQSPHD